MKNIESGHRIEMIERKDNIWGQKFYPTPDGDFYSVTQILSLPAKPALPQWAAECKRCQREHQAWMERL